MGQRALLLVNCHARQGQENFQLAIHHLQGIGFELVVDFPEKPQQLSDTIRHYCKQVDLVIIGGGDGTLNAALEGLVDTQLPLGILPLGTANDLARTLGIPQSLPAACDVIARGLIQRIDLGWINGKHFFNVASLGLSVQITKRLSKESKRRWRVLAYLVAALQVFWKTRLFQAEIRWNNQSFQVRTFQIAVGNGRYYGGGLCVADNAVIDDKRLDLYSLEVQHWWEIIPLLPAIKQGRYATLHCVRSLQGQEIELHTRKPCPITTDGELSTQTPARFRVVPQALSVFCPNVK